MLSTCSKLKYSKRNFLFRSVGVTSVNKKNVKMVQKKTATSWNLQEFDFTYRSDGETDKIFCKICKEFYANHKEEALKLLKGSVKLSVENWINVSTVVTKNNAVDHIKSNFHRVSVLRLKDHASKSVLKSDAEQASCFTDIGKHQTTLSENVKRMLGTHKTELIKKFPLAHFTVINNYLFNTYEKIAKFEKES